MLPSSILRNANGADSFRPALADTLGWSREITIGLSLACAGAVSSTVFALALTMFGVREAPAMIGAFCLTLVGILVLVWRTNHGSDSQIRRGEPPVVAIHGVGGPAKSTFWDELRKTPRSSADRRAIHLFGSELHHPVRRFGALEETGIPLEVHVVHVVADTLSSTLLFGLVERRDDPGSLCVWADRVIIVTRVGSGGRRVLESLTLDARQQEYLRSHPRCLDEPERIMSLLQEISRN
ncbi:MAG: hypothetical protein ACYC61_19535 [Isosphaeraceae bacterium]